MSGASGGGRIVSVYKEGSGYFIRDFEKTRKEFADRQDQPQNWQEYEHMLGNCCDRLLRDIDKRFKYLAEYLWNKIQLDCATSELVDEAFQKNFEEIDKYVQLQFDWAKKQLERLMKKSSQRSPSMDRRSNASTGFSTGIRKASTKTMESGSGTSSSVSQTSETTIIRRSSASQTTMAESGFDSRATVTSSYPSGSGSRSTGSGTTSGGSTDHASDSSSWGTKHSSGSGSYPSGYGSYSGSAGSSNYTDMRSGVLVQPMPWTSSMTSIFPKGLRTQSLFALGFLVGIGTLLLLMYLSLYLPPSVTQYIPFHIHEKECQRDLMETSDKPLMTLVRPDRGLRARPYDAFWTSCGSSFGEWWTYTWDLLLNK